VVEAGSRSLRLLHGWNSEQHRKQLGIQRRKSPFKRVDELPAKLTKLYSPGGQAAVFRVGLLYFTTDALECRQPSPNYVEGADGIFSLLDPSVDVCRVKLLAEVSPTHQAVETANLRRRYKGTFFRQRRRRLGGTILRLVMPRLSSWRLWGLGMKQIDSELGGLRLKLLLC
jgi:hypothetical protein